MAEKVEGERGEEGEKRKRYGWSSNLDQLYPVSPK